MSHPSATTEGGGGGGKDVKSKLHHQKTIRHFGKALGGITLMIIALLWQRYMGRRARNSRTFGFKSLTSGLLAGLSIFMHCIGLKGGASDFSENPGRVPKRQALYGIHPHGAYLHGIGTHIVHELYGGRGASLSDLRIVAADAVFQVPVFREVALMLGMRSASNRVMDKLLEDGYSVGLAPGGVHEQINTDPEREHLYFAKKLGFVRTAMKHGVPLVPLYNFGENQLYNVPKWSRALSQSLKKFGAGFALGVGRWNLPFLPLPQKVETRIGREIDVGPPNAKPSDAEVEQIFKAYCAELLRLFDEHKSALPPAVAARGLSLTWIGHGDMNLSVNTLIEMEGRNGSYGMQMHYGNYVQMERLGPEPETSRSSIKVMPNSRL